MQPQSLEHRAAQLAERCGLSVVLLDILRGQLDRQRAELRELQAAIAAQSTVQPGTPAEITPAMLAGSYGS